MSRRLVGTWSCTSGNEVDVYLTDDAGTIECLWDLYPLSASDRAEWTTRILPAVVTRVGELLERPGPAVVIQT